MLFAADLVAHVSDEERDRRQLATELGVDIVEMDRIQSVFNDADKDGNGFIDRDEFRQMLLKFMKAKDATDLPDGRLKRFWQTIDPNGRGNVDLRSFVVWLKQYGGDILPGRQGTRWGARYGSVGRQFGC